MRSRYEQLIEYIINDETDKAKELFHNLVVEKSRDLYNELVAEEMEEEMDENYDHDMDEAGDSMDQTDDMMHDIEADHEGMDHDDMDMGDDGMEMGDDDEDDSLDSDNDGMGDHDEPATKGDLASFEDELDALKAEFEKLMSQEAEEPEHQGMGTPEEGVVREYVEKAGEAYKGEFAGKPNGKPVGAGTGEFIKTGETNPKSVVAGKNDMGGTVKNLVRGDTNEDPDGKTYKGPRNEYSKGEGKLPGNGKFLNTPGANGGKAFSNAKKPQSAEGKFATGGGPNINKKDVLPR
jgi:hypothetical protein